MKYASVHCICVLLARTWASLVAQMVKNPPAKQDPCRPSSLHGRFLGLSSCLSRVLLGSSDSQAHRSSHPSRPRVGPCGAPRPLLFLAPSGHACGAAPGPQEGYVQRGPGCIQHLPPSSGLQQPRARPPPALRGPGRPLSPWSGKSRSPAEGRAFSVTSETRELGQQSRGSHQAQGSCSQLD